MWDPASPQHHGARVLLVTWVTLCLAKGTPMMSPAPQLGLCSCLSSADVYRAVRPLLVPSLLGISQFSDNRETKGHVAHLSSWPELVLLGLNPSGQEGLCSWSTDLPGTLGAGVCFHPAAYSPTSHSTHPWLNCDPDALLFILMHSGS